MSASEAKSANLIWKFLIPAGVILALVVGGLSIVKSQNLKSHPESVQIKGSDTISDFTLEPFQGKSGKFSDLKAKVTLLNFWATWCEACIEEMPSIVDLQHSYRDRGFQVVAVNVDDKPEAVLPKAIKDLGLDFQIYTDADQKLTELFKVNAIPLTLILDSNRKVLFSKNGEYQWNKPEFRAQLEEWLKK